MGGECLKFVGGRRDIKAQRLCELITNKLIETLEAVDTGSNGCAPNGKLLQPVTTMVDVLQAPLDLTSEGREFLANGDWRSVLHVSASYFQDFFKPF